MRWRLIRDGYHDGATNMATDEAIMLAHGRGRVPPTLRLYGWRPPALSLGYAQKVEREVDLEGCRRAGVDVVRRPTGGRAVLHDREVTYSVVISTALLPGSVVETYRCLSAGLVEGLRLLGLQAEVQEGPPRAGLRSAACFDTPSWYELVVEGRKVVGSAQVRRQGVLLQHGSVPLEFSPVQLVGLLRLPAGWRARLEEDLSARAAGLCDLGRGVTFTGVCDALAEGFRRALGLELEERGLTAHEQEEAARLREEKYATWEWNVLGKLQREGAAGV
ncbi:MAG: biotin/lipoate A/B protein ligase family protein [Bacillota bacterium]|nr:biotin/lipoate A/B protein ligase family protein [Bacillota bacterium]